MTTVNERKITESPPVEPVGLLLGVVIGALISILLNIAMLPKEEEPKALS